MFVAWAVVLLVRLAADYLGFEPWSLEVCALFPLIVQDKFDIDNRRR